MCLIYICWRRGGGGGVRKLIRAQRYAYYGCLFLLFLHFHCWPICTHSRFVCFCSIYMYHPALMTRNQNFVVCFWKLEIIKWKLVGNDFNLKIASALYASFHFINIQYSFYWSPVVLLCRVWFVLDSTLIIVRHNLCF